LQFESCTAHHSAANVFWSYSTLDWLKNDWRTRWFCFGLGFLLAQAAWAQQAAHVDGVVRDPNGKTVPGVHVILYLDDASAHYEAQTDADGTFTLSVAAGRYQLRAEQSAYSAVEDSFPLNAGEAKHCELTLRLTEATKPHAHESSSASIKFDDRPSFTVAGVTDSTGSGGHGSETRVRTGEVLARETASLPPGENKSSITKIPEPSPPAAEADLRTALARSPRDFEANRQLGEFYFRSQRFREAIAPLEAAHRIRSSDYSVALHLGAAYKACERFNEARSVVTERLAKTGALTPIGQADLYRLLGDIDEKQNDPLAAEHEYERASALDASEQNYFTWGAELLLHGAGAPAVEVFSKGIRLHPESVRMLGGLGAALYAAGSAEEAAQRLCAASDLDRTNDMPYLLLGKIQEATSPPLPCAEATLARYARLHPDRAIANYYYGLALWKQDRAAHDPARLQLAETLLREATDLDPTLDAADVALGNLYLSQSDLSRPDLSHSDPQAAIAAYQKALAANPDNSEAHYGLGVAYRRIGQNDRAETEIQRYKLLQTREEAALEHRRSAMGQFLFYLNNQPAGAPATSNSVPSAAR